MASFKKIIENNNLLACLIILLLIVSIVQGFFLVKLNRSLNRDSSAAETNRQFNGNFGLRDDQFNPFDSQKWDPFEEFQSMREQMDRMFDDSSNRLRLSPFFDKKRQNTIMPQTDLVEEDNRYVVKMNIPGSEEAEIKVDLEGDTLTVRAKTIHTAENKKGDSFLRMERSIGSFQRSIPLPGPVDGSTMNTEYKNGVLTIILPKKTTE